MMNVLREVAVKRDALIGAGRRRAWRAVWTPTATSARASEPAVSRGRVRAGVQSGSEAGISIRPAPCALAIRNDQSGETDHAGLHADAHAVAVAVERVP